MIKLFIVLLSFFNILNAITLTKEEVKFLKENPIIILGGDKNWVPYTQQSSDGIIKGFDKDLLDEVNRLTGANFQLELGNWKDLEKKAKNRQIDGLSTSSKHQERAQYFNFSKTYVSHDINLLVKYGNPKYINNEEDLVGKTIVVQKGNLFAEKLAKKFTGATIIYKNTTEATIYEVIYGNADAAIGNGSTQYLKNEFGLPYLSNAFSLDNKLNLVFSIRKDWPEAISILNKGLASITQEKKAQLKEKWFKKINFNIKETITLTVQENNYIKSRDKVKICADPSWHSFSQVNESLMEKNFAIKYMDILLAKIGLEKESVYTKSWEESLQFIKEKKCDLITSIHRNKERMKYINFTSPYVEYPVMLMTHKNTPYLLNMKRLDNKKVAILKGHALEKLFKQKYPHSEVVYINDGVEALKKVKSGEVYGFIELLPMLVQIVNKVDDIKINKEIGINLDLSIGVVNNDPMLLSILEKALKSIPEKEKIRIFEQLIKIQYEDNSDYIKLLYGVLILIFLIMIVTYWNIQLKKGIKKASLENKKQQSLLYYFSKQDAMKNLLANISHQWKQPINELSGIIMHMETKLMLNKSISTELIASTTIRSRNIIDFMSETIDTFNNFYEINNKKESIYIDKVFDDVIFMLKGYFEENNIKVNLKLKKNSIRLNIYSNSLKQVILSILNNANDIFKFRDIKFPEILINVQKIKGFVYIYIKDNGGGIKAEILEDIFDISATDKSTGIGIGLYISKKIIEEKFNGYIYAENTKKGACFIIKIPI